MNFESLFVVVVVGLVIVFVRLSLTISSALVVPLRVLQESSSKIIVISFIFCFVHLFSASSSAFTPLTFLLLHQLFYSKKKKFDDNSDQLTERVNSETTNDDSSGLFMTFTWCDDFVYRCDDHRNYDFHENPNICTSWAFRTSRTTPNECVTHTLDPNFEILSLSFYIVGGIHNQSYNKT